MTLKNEFIPTNPFSEDFSKQWDFWKRYKKEDHNFTYRSAMSEQAALNELVYLSDGNEQEAVRIINRSMAQGWKGLFRIHKPKEDGQPTKKKTTRGATTDDLKAVYVKRNGTEG
jgi:hypothetical protein